MTLDLARLDSGGRDLFVAPPRQIFGAAFQEWTIQRRGDDMDVQDHTEVQPTARGERDLLCLGEGRDLLRRQATTELVPGLDDVHRRLVDGLAHLDSGAEDPARGVRDVTEGV